MSDSGEPYEDAGIAEGCIDPEEGDAGPKLEKPSGDQGDRWEKTDKCWRYYRVKPQQGLVNPNRFKSPPGPNGYKDLNGQRRTLATIPRDNGPDEELVLEDHWDIPQGWKTLEGEDKRVSDI